jgi:hypothetical protein
MSPFGAILFFFIFTAFLGIAFTYAKARQTTRAYRQKRHKYETLAGSLPQLKDHVAIEADRWPMYARPVLFTDLDHSSQLEFAKAEQALNNADQMLPEIETIGEPETSEHFQLIELINVPKNLRSISLGNQIFEGLSAFEETIVNLKSSLKSLRANRHQVERKRLAVQKSLGELDRRTKQINRRLKPLDVWKSIEDHNFSWVVNIAIRCQQEAANSINNVHEDEQGYIEYAKADVLVAMGTFSLECIELFLESQKISRRYDLDSFFESFNDATGFFHSILEMDVAWSSWRKLRTIKPYIEVLPSKGKVAERSLLNFRSRKRRLEWLIDQVNIIDIESEVRSADKLEAECTYYWYSHQERKAYWEKALGSPVILPSEKLYDFQALLVGEINPEIDVYVIIKQSQIIGLIEKVGSALEFHEAIKREVLSLTTELDLHKKTEKIIKELLGTEGPATLIFTELKSLIEDTSPNLNDWGQNLVSKYQNYSKKANDVRGADLPELLDSIDEFIADSEQLVRQHRSQLDELKSSYDIYNEQVYALRMKLHIFLNHVPRYEIKSLDLFSEALEKSESLMGLLKVDTYSGLRESVNAMEEWVIKNNSLVSRAHNRYQTFESGKKQVETLMAQTSEELHNKKSYAESKWGWYRTEIMSVIDNLSRSFDFEQSNWKDLVETNWAEYNIGRAISECRRLIKFCNNVMLDLARALEKADGKQKEIENKATAILRLLQTRSSKITQPEKQDIETLVKIAQEYSNFDFAKKLLENAHSMALGRAGAQVRIDATNYIYVYSKGGPVFLERVINSGNIMGAIRMLQAKGVRHYEKKR